MSMSMRTMRKAALVAAATLLLPGAARAVTVIYSFAGEVDTVAETEVWQASTGLVRSSEPGGAPFQVKASFTVRTGKLPQNVATAPDYALYVSGPLAPADAWLTSVIEGVSADGATWPLALNGEGDVVLYSRGEDALSPGNALVTAGPSPFEFGTTIFEGQIVRTQFRQYFRSALLNGAGSFVSGGVRLPDFTTGLNAPFATFESVSIADLTYFNSDDQVVFSERRVYGLRKAVPITVTILPSAVPEPAQWAMMLIGFGITGAALRRSGRKVQPLGLVA